MTKNKKPRYGGVFCFSGVLCCVCGPKTCGALFQCLKIAARGRNRFHYYLLHMAISRAKKEDQIERLREIVKQGISGSLVFISFRQISAKRLAQIRAEYFRKGISFRVAKKTLIKKAFENTNIPGEMPPLEGEIAILAGSDSLLPARTTVSFKLGRDAVFAPVGGVYEGAFVDATTMNMLANIPDRETLLTRLVGMVETPLRQWVAVLHLIAGKRN